MERSISYHHRQWRIKLNCLSEDVTSPHVSETGWCSTLPFCRESCASSPEVFGRTSVFVERNDHHRILPLSLSVKACPLNQSLLFRLVRSRVTAHRNGCGSTYQGVSGLTSVENGMTKLDILQSNDSVVRCTFIRS